MEQHLITQDDSVLALESGDTLIAIAQNAAKRVEAVTQIKSLALKVTNAHDWIDENGKPYLQVSGAEKVARLFGVSWRIDDAEFDEHEDGHFTYTYKGYFMLAGKEIEAIGTRSSRDKFFSRARGSDIDPSTISRGNVKKSAYTNCLGNGITRLLGIRNMSWDELKAAGLTKSQSTTVDRSAGPRAPKYGEYANRPLAEVTDEWLDRYANACANDLDDPKKKKFKKYNEQMLSNLIEEIDRRKKEAVSSPAAVQGEESQEVTHE
ncbi:MAG: hypothetical protein NPIRA02_10830 [Nitrospirales bacterium]|nr:MAG: hypothetical protein NPIRA02_10830 [Nitrospirales bacterium]